MERRKYWVTVWVECAAGCVSLAFFAMTVVWHDWIEVLFGVDPDHGSGALEWIVAITLLVITGMSAHLARRSYFLRRNLLVATED